MKDYSDRKDNKLYQNFQPHRFKNFPDRLKIVKFKKNYTNQLIFVKIIDKLSKSNKKILRRRTYKFKQKITQINKY